jgi:His Kinase A (phosphoacceptor) domain.
LVEIQKDFINNVTHEFSTPLSVIELSVDGLEKPAAHANQEKQQKVYKRYSLPVRLPEKSYF